MVSIPYTYGMTNIYSSLNRIARRVVQSLKKKGWKFKDDYWEDHHNGTPYYDVSFKSPRMKDFVNISERDWPTITEAQLIELEANHLANKWAKSAFSYEGHIQRPVAAELKKYFIKQKSPFSKEFSSYDREITYDVKNFSKNQKQHTRTSQSDN